MTETAPMGNGGSPNVVLAASDQTRVSDPGVDPATIQELTGANQAFALDLYRYLAERSEGNLFMSPHSISVALAMAYAGAAGETAEEMADTLHFTLPENELHPAFNALDQALAQRGEGAEGQDDEGFRLHVVNALWGQQEYEFEEAFLDTLARHYGAGMRLVDFVRQAETARRMINTWIEEQTEGRIEDLIPEGALNSMTRLVLTNAIYFNAAWADPFDAEQTEEETFYLLDGTTTDVAMMHKTASFNYAAGAGYQAVEIPYDGHELSMVLIVPDEGRFVAFEQGLDAPRLEEILGTLNGERVALGMPKFETTSKFGLSEALRDLGMPTAFSENANFSGMTGDRELFISDVLHQAFVSVDEEGTEAAAATAVMMSATSVQPEGPVELTIDRPFIFLIRDIETGAQLFMGRTMDPSGS